MLACRYLCQYSISIDDVTIANGLLLKFCSRFVQIYGIDSVTPNMHMHCHLASSIKEFGPMHSFGSSHLNGTMVF